MGIRLYESISCIEISLECKNWVEFCAKIDSTVARGNFFSSPRPNEESGATVTDIPNWFYNRFSHRQFKDTHLPWYQIPDFDEQIGDIKGIWEISRMQWVLDFVVRERKQQDGLALHELDCWLNDWCCNNPAYLGRTGNVVRKHRFVLCT